VEEEHVFRFICIDLLFIFKKGEEELVEQNECINLEINRQINK